MDGDGVWTLMNGSGNDNGATNVDKAYLFVCSALAVPLTSNLRLRSSRLTSNL